MRSAAELKGIFQDGWNMPARVENYVRNVAHGEFDRPQCREAWQKCLTNAISKPGKLKILDVGTGPGFFACLYSQMGHESVGLDFSNRMLKEAREYSAELQLPCTFIFGDAEDPPFEANTFDVISSRHLLFNLPRPGIAIRQWLRILKPGGKMILIGNDSHDGRKPRPVSGFKHRLGRYLKFLSKNHSPGWQPPAGYIDAVSECPLFKHGPGAIWAIMEAAGLEHIHFCLTDAISDARLKNHSFLKKSRRNVPERPYILVGTKPENQM